MDEKIRSKLEKQGYRIAGNHSAIKVCLWCKKAIRKEDVCYKNTFYGIHSWQCVQMTPALLNCTHRCQFCWRYLDCTIPNAIQNPDSPKEIIDGCIKEHIEYLQGFFGNPKADKKRIAEALKPRHFAISLAGEPCLYPKLPELVKELKKRKITSFVVSNGTVPEMIAKLKKTPLTQLYITLPAPNEELYKKVCNPLVKDGWKKLMKSVSMLKDFKRNVLRLTVVKGLNMVHPEQYAAIIKKYKPQFVEIKAYMNVGYSQYRLPYESMPKHNEILEFAADIAKYSGCKIIDQKPESRVVLLAKKDFKGRKMKFK